MSRGLGDVYKRQTEDNAEIIKAKALSRLTKQLQEAQDDPVSYSEDEVYKMFGVEK